MTHPIRPEPRGRPASVRVAAYLMLAAALLITIRQFAWWVFADTIADAAGLAYGDGSGPDPRMAEVAGFAGALDAAGWLVVASLLTIAAVYGYKGSRVSRILCWVFGGVVLWGYGTLAGFRPWVDTKFGVIETTLVLSTDYPVDQSQLLDSLDARLPFWYQPLVTALMALALLAVITALVLLAVPSSNRFFRPAVTVSRAVPTRERPEPSPIRSDQQKS